MKQTRRGLLASIGAVATGTLAGCQLQARNQGRIDPAELPPSEHADAQFRGGLKRQGVYPDATIPDEGQITQTHRGLNTGEHTAAKASPVQEPSGDIVVPGDSGEVWRVSPSGERVWTASVEDTPRGMHGTPAIANGTVYIGAYDGALYAFDLETGERYWRSDLGDAIGSSPAYYDGTIYVAVEYHDPSGTMFAVDAVDGSVEWKDPRPTNHPHSTCAIDRDGGRLVVGANDGVLYGWSYPDLEFEWEFQTERAIKGPIATYDGSAFVGSWDETLYRVDLEDGVEEWSFDAFDLVMSGPSIEASTDTLYFCSHDTFLYALDVETGEERWDYDTGGRLIGCPTVTAEHVLVGSYDNHLYAVEKDGGEEAWTVEGVGRVTSTPLVTDDAVYFTDRASPAYLSDSGGKSGALYRVE